MPANAKCGLIFVSAINCKIDKFINITIGESDAKLGGSVITTKK